jgi:hypothetical protein
VAEQIARVRTHVRALAPLSFKDRRRYLTERWRPRSAQTETPDPAVSDIVMARRLEVQAATVAAIRRYTPRHFAGRVCLFLPNAAAQFDKAMLRWRTVARDTEEYAGPAGGHGDSMLLEPQVRVTVETVRRCRDKL